ncbi:hypothetical protein Gogos_022228 [Gossypium gossypioides]|uniref:Uncharacterized protein n=1 Tax=Gossypium gossypioides TaxID=34282 RepID=A0A7J9D4K2_GOSGO|nr:hypothetical protein [Gossypium gossypioides]
MQFIPTTHGLVESEFSYKDDGYKKKRDVQCMEPDSLDEEISCWSNDNS